MTDLKLHHHSVLITGGAGYIGSHLALLLLKQGYKVTIFDNLSTGNEWAVCNSSLIRADILDTDLLVRVMQEHRVQCVIHLAAKSSVSESFIKPELYYETNVKGTISVVEACAKAGVQQLLFSSTAAVYGNGTHGLVKEDAALNPISPYGHSKLEAEQTVVGLCRSHGLRHMIFRFFNVIGAHPEGGLGQCNANSGHLLQKCFDVVREHGELAVFGNDYDTADATAERDYIHVQDLVSLLAQAIYYLHKDGSSQILNAGYGNSHSVLKFIKVFETVTNSVLPLRFESRREGDPASLIADVSRLGELLDWTPEYASLEQMITSSWEWENSPKRRLLG